MNPSEFIYLHVWTGVPQQARALVEQRFPGAEITEISHRELRAGGWKRQVRSLRELRGKALVVYFDCIEEAPQLQLVQWSGLLHHCRETIVADTSGKWKVYRRWDWLWLFPKTITSALIDGVVLALSFAFLAIWKGMAQPPPFNSASGDFDIAYLFPFPLMKDVAGGAISHIRGVLGGVAANGATCRIFSGAPLPVQAFEVRVISAKRRLFLFWESLMLSYSLQFAREVCRMLAGTRPTMFYQRSGRFVVAGALLSQWTRIPLVLEYNGSELWMADYWDPTRFRTWVRFCEEFSLRCASAIVVVSDPIRQEVLQRGIPGERVIVSPNAVDPDHFRPGCGGEQVRQKLGISGDQILVAFVGTFSYWHGIPVLQEAILSILRGRSLKPIQFLLVGEGPLHAEMRRDLHSFEDTGKVIFTGIVPHEQVRSYLDAADILVSPHVPLPDGRPFFGSPTKLFEYMAMGKAIAASRLDQLAQVLSQNETALLVSPGDVQELVAAIYLLAEDDNLRRRLGKRAREVAIERHTWRQNAARVLQFGGHSDRPLSEHGAEELQPGDIRKGTIATS